MHLWTRAVGQGGATPVVVPGAVVDEDLASLGRDRVALFYDSRNRGRSARVVDLARLGFWMEVADAEAVRAWAGYERAAWVGWSYLAGVVAQHALAHPVRVERLVLVSPIGPASAASAAAPDEVPPGGLARLDQLRAAGTDRTDPRYFCEVWHEVYDPLQVHDPDSLARRRSRPCEHPNEWPSRVTTALAHVFLDLGSYDWRPQLAGLDVPTLVVHGSADTANAAAVTEWVTTLPDARLLTLDGVGRLPWLEAPDAFFDAVHAFLSGTWPPAARR